MEFIKARLKINWEMVKELLNGIMARFTLVNGKLVQKMEMVFGNLTMEVYIKENGKWINNMGKENMCIHQVHIKVNLLNL